MTTDANGPQERHVELNIEGLHKSYGETKALVDVQLQVTGGSIRCILGENGSGKSTLVKILSGVLEADGGRVELNGQSVRFRSPAEAQRHGIVTVFQEILNTPNQTVWENLTLGTSREGLTTDEASEMLGRLSASPPALHAVVGGLALSKQQIVAIARALLRDPKVLILDEPTSALDPQEVARFLQVVRDEQTRGTAVLFITHRFDEVLGVADEISIIRGGASVGDMPRAAATAQEVLRLMSGGTHAAAAKRKIGPVQQAAVRITAEAVSTWTGKPPVAVEVHDGELLGIAGLEGHGQEPFLARLAGFGRPDNGHVRVRLDSGDDVEIRSAGDAAQARVAYVPRDRKTEGLFLPLPILDNFAVASYRRFASSVGFLYRQREMNSFRHFAEILKLQYTSSEDPVASLSGGNQQKVILARWLATEPKVMLLNDPTRGVDIPTKEDLYELLHTACENGMSAVFLSTDTVELVNHADRVIVFREGQISATLSGDNLTSEGVLAAMFGEVA